ncbi:MAG: Smr/MutS family protein, partial [Bacilli bacterium]|nr:Smr/MutS family protein [Bacilli bacterium]
LKIDRDLTAAYELMKRYYYFNHYWYEYSKKEALAYIEKYIDECLLRHYKRVRIIHGWGSGALRNLTRTYCDTHKNIVASYEGASGEEGGGGATIVHLK